MNIFRNQYPSLALLLQYFVTVVVRSQSASIDVLSTSLVSSSSVIPTPNDSLSSNDASYISIPATSVAVCTVLIILAIIILVLLVKKTKRRVVIIRPPDVENPHYNNCNNNIILYVNKFYCLYLFSNNIVREWKWPIQSQKAVLET